MRLAIRLAVRPTVSRTPIVIALGAAFGVVFACRVLMASPAPTRTGGVEPYSLAAVKLAVHDAQSGTALAAHGRVEGLGSTADAEHAVHVTPLRADRAHVGDDRALRRSTVH